MRACCVPVQKKSLVCTTFFFFCKLFFRHEKCWGVPQRHAAPLTEKKLGAGSCFSSRNRTQQCVGSWCMPLARRTCTQWNDASLSTRSAAHSATSRSTPQPTSRLTSCDTNARASIVFEETLFSLRPVGHATRGTDCSLRNNGSQHRAQRISRSAATLPGHHGHWELCVGRGAATMWPHTLWR